MLLVWALAWAAALAYVARHATELAFLDDLAVVEGLRPDRPITWSLLWSQHNEHRIPLVRLIHLGTMLATHSFRATALLNVALLGLVALGMVLAARRMRGATRLGDAAFPLLLLHLGHAENLLNAFQVVLIVPLALLCGVLALVAWHPHAPGVRRTLAIVGCMLLLALCGLPGITPLPALLLWLVWLGLRAAGRESLELRRAGALGLAGAAAVAVLVGLVFVGFRFLPGTTRAGPGRALEVAAQVVAQSLGWAARAWWPWSLAAVLALLAAAAGLALVSAARDPTGRPRSLGLIAFLGGILTLALAIGFGRGNDQAEAGFLSRYGHLSAPLLCGACIAFAAFDRARPARHLQGAALLLAAAAYAFDVRPALELGRQRVVAAAGLEAELDAGVSLPAIAARRWRDFYYGESDFLEVLQHLRAAGMPPFAGRRGAASGPPAYPMFAAEPIAVLAAKPPAPYRIRGIEVLLVHAPSEVRFRLDGGASRASGSFGLHPQAMAMGRSDGALFLVELLPAGEAPQVLFQRLLLPSEARDQLLHTFEVELPPGVTGDLALRTANVPGSHADMDWAFWTLVDLR